MAPKMNQNKYGKWSKAEVFALAEELAMMTPEKHEEMLKRDIPNELVEYAMEMVYEIGVLGKMPW